MRRKSLSELECFVLGLIWQLGPSSAYDIRRHMLQSPSTQWSASAGAIYPLFRKLERLRLLSARAAPTGKRARRLYRITPAGERAVRAWIGPPLPPDAITVAHDPLRSRARFLTLLPPSARTAWTAAALSALDTVESRVRAWAARHQSDGDNLGPTAALLTRTGELDIASRRRWLTDLQRVTKRAR